eukprot:264913-Prymnesium_polylepis.1
MQQPADVSEAMVKAFLPLPKTSWDSWPCAPNDPQIFVIPNASDAAAASFDRFVWVDASGREHAVPKAVMFPSGLYESIGSAFGTSLLGAHFWHAALDHALVDTNRLALLLCPCSPVYSQHLARRFRLAMGIVETEGEGHEPVSFTLHAGTHGAGWDSHRCREDYCERGAPTTGRGAGPTSSRGPSPSCE